MSIVEISQFVTNILIAGFKIFRFWWWFILPIIFYFLARYLYAFWVRHFFWYRQFVWTIFEIKPPKEVLKPFKAMEDIFSVLWGTIDIPNWRERWCEGELPFGGGLWFSFEITSFGGDIHFYLRIPEFFENAAKAAIYSQYPDAEIQKTDDYTQKVPQDVPNKEWDMYGEDFSFIKPDCYPIRTYEEFFEPSGERITKEEKRLDPMDSLLEHLSKIQSGEQIWCQFICIPITNDLVSWVDEAKTIIAKIARREKILPIGVTEEEEEREMVITPGEKRILTAIEKKISKPAYQTTIRTIHIYKRKGPYVGGNYKILSAYLNHFATVDMNAIRRWKASRTRIHYFFRQARLFTRKKAIFKWYIERTPSYWPRSPQAKPIFQAVRGGGKGTVILNTEELASLFHFPTKITVPTVPRVEAKKGGPPSSLPIEE